LTKQILKILKAGIWQRINQKIKEYEECKNKCYEGIKKYLEQEVK
jgi:hypothetical protein